MAKEYERDGSLKFVKRREFGLTTSRIDEFNQCGVYVVDQGEKQGSAVSCGRPHGSTVVYLIRSRASGAHSFSCARPALHHDDFALHGPRVPVYQYRYGQ